MGAVTMYSAQSSLKCDDEKIAAIEEAFDATWTVIQANDPDRDLKYDCERMAALSQKLAELVADGVTDPAELRRLALQAGPLWQAPPVENTVPTR
jgi:hypothetical protein